MKLDTRTFDIIKHAVIPKSRADFDELLLADWETILEFASYVGIDIASEITRLDNAATELIPSFDGLKLLTLEERRTSLAILDRHLQTHHLRDFEEKLQRIQTQLKLEAIEISPFAN